MINRSIASLFTNFVQASQRFAQEPPVLPLGSLAAADSSQVIVVRPLHLAPKVRSQLNIWQNIAAHVALRNDLLLAGGY